MPAFNGNSCYLRLDAVDPSAVFVAFSMEPKNNAQNTSAGTGITHVSQAAGLTQTDATLELAYDTSTISSYIQKLKAGAIIVVDWGPEGNTAGKPRHTQSFLVVGAPIAQKIEKELVKFTANLTSAAAPTNDFYGGATF